MGAGFIIGLERGWREREQAEGSRVAGLRTFALIGLLGGAAATLHDHFGVWPLAMGLFALALLGAVSYREWVRVSGNLSATSTIAALLAYTLGAMAASGSPVLAVGVAVIVAVLLDLKSTLHRWLRVIEHRELSAALQMLVLSVVVLPWLPDRGYGPYEALNPYGLWWAVVLVVGLSLAGHVAMRFTGPQRGTFWTGVLAGLASSTAATLALSRRARDQPGLLDPDRRQPRGLRCDASAHGGDRHAAAASTGGCARRSAHRIGRCAAGTQRAPAQARRVAPH